MVFVHEPYNNNYRVAVDLDVDDPELLLIKRIKACVGWAVHGLVIEFWNGKRVGYGVGGPVAAYNDATIAKRGQCSAWYPVRRGDFIRKITGHQLTRECFLCHSLVFHFASGRSINLESQYEPWKGDAFSFDVPEDALVYDLTLDMGRCTSVAAAKTMMHLPCQSLKRIATLPKTHKQTFDVLQLVSRRLDDTMTTNTNTNALPLLGRDLWDKILLEYLACGDLEPYHQSPLGKLEWLQKQGKASPIDKRAPVVTRKKKEEQEARFLKEMELTLEMELLDMGVVEDAFDSIHIMDEDNNSNSTMERSYIRRLRHIRRQQRRLGRRGTTTSI